MNKDPVKDEPNQDPKEIVVNIPTGSMGHREYGNDIQKREDNNGNRKINEDKSIGTNRDKDKRK